MPRVSKKTEVPAVPEAPSTPATPAEPAPEATPATELGATVKVKHRKTGKTHVVSRAYYENNQEKLDVVS